MVTRFSLTLLCVLALAPAAEAQTSLTLSEAVSRATSDSPQVRAAQAQVEAASARLAQASVLPNPNLSLVIDQVPFSQPASGNYMAGVSQPLLLGGQREAREAAALLDREAATLALALLQRSLAAQVHEAYARLLFERATVSMAVTDRDAADVLAKAAVRLVKAGEVAPVESLRAQVELNRAQQAIRTAESRALKAGSQLNVLMGRPASEALAVVELPTRNLAEAGALHTSVAEGLKSRIEIRQAETAIAREVAQRRVAQTSLWTGTEISVLGGAVGGNGPGFSAALTLPIPLYRQQGEIAEAEANARRAQAERDELLIRITLEVEEAYRDATIARGQVEVFANSYLPQAERLADNARRRFLAGEGSVVEVIEARRALAETRMQFQQSLLDYRLSTASLARAIGQPHSRP